MEANVTEDVGDAGKESGSDRFRGQQTNAAVTVGSDTSGGAAQTTTSSSSPSGPPATPSPTP